MSLAPLMLHPDYNMHEWRLDDDGIPRPVPNACLYVACGAAVCYGFNGDWFCTKHWQENGLWKRS